MRITGGVLKGRIMKCPDGIIRPAMDRMRESVFAVLGDLSGKSWLDLFSHYYRNPDYPVYDIDDAVGLVHDLFAPIEIEVDRRGESDQRKNDEN